MSHLLDEILAQAANGSPETVALSSESVAVLLFASEFIERRENWLDRGFDPLDEVTDADWDAIEKLVGNAYEAIMTPLLGQIMPIALAVIPFNMLLCDGASYARVDYPELYAVLDSVFIVDADNFIVPDLLSRVVVGAGHGSGLSPYSVGATGGEEAHALSSIENAAHAHTLNDPGHAHLEQVGSTPAYLATGGTGRTGFSAVTTSNTTRVTTDSKTTSMTMDNSGNGVGHNNIQPYYALQWAIVAF